MDCQTSKSTSLVTQLQSNIIKESKLMEEILISCTTKGKNLNENLNKLKETRNEVESLLDKIKIKFTEKD